jgi:hypothetical protein
MIYVILFLFFLHSLKFYFIYVLYLSFTYTLSFIYLSL